MEEAPRRQVQRWEAVRCWVLLGLVLVVAGTSALMLGGPSESAAPDRLSRNHLINRSASELGDISANNSPAAARNPIDPANVVVANRVDQPRFSCAVRASVDGAETWHDAAVPFPAGEEEPARCYAPDVAYGPDGILYLSYVTLKGLGNAPNALWVASSFDGGRTFRPPSRVAGALAFQARLTADPDEPNRLNLTWLQASAVSTLGFPSTGNPVVTAISLDRGANWSDPMRVSPESRARVVAPSPTAGPGGSLYVLYLDLLDDRLDYTGAHEGRGGDSHAGPWALVLARSADRGVTWLESVLEDDLVPTQRFVVFLPPSPSVAVDPESGRIYVAFTNGRLGDADVQMWISEDGGLSFGPPLRVNDTASSDGSSQYLPRVEVSPGGRVDVVYLDRRADTMDTLNEVSFQSSFDHGRTFTRRLVLTDQPFDSRVGPGGDRALPDLGSRIALVSSRDLVFAVWPDTRGGTEADQKQDLASAIVDVPDLTLGPLPWLQVVGAAVSVVGMVILVVAGLRMVCGRDDGPAGRRCVFSDG